MNYSELKEKCKWNNITLKNLSEELGVTMVGLRYMFENRTYTKETIDKINIILGNDPESDANSSVKSNADYEKIILEQRIRINELEDLCEHYKKSTKSLDIAIEAVEKLLKQKQKGTKD